MGIIPPTLPLTTLKITPLPHRPVDRQENPKAPFHVISTIEASASIMLISAPIFIAMIHALSLFKDNECSMWLIGKVEDYW